MKKLITLLAVTTSFVLFTPSIGQARDSHGHSSRSVSHNCGSCGTSVYRERAVVGHDRHGHPSYGWRTVGHSCRPSHSGGHNSGHGSSRSGNQGHISLPGFHLDFGGQGGRH